MEDPGHSLGKLMWGRGWGGDGGRRRRGRGGREDVGEDSNRLCGSGPVMQLQD